MLVAVSSCYHLFTINTVKARNAGTGTLPALRPADKIDDTEIGSQVDFFCSDTVSSPKIAQGFPIFVTSGLHGVWMAQTSFF